VSIIKGKSALITGATGGLGKEIALSMISCGVNVHVLGNNEKKLNNLMLDLNGLNEKQETKVNICFSLLDFCNLQSIDNFLSSNNNFDILINCAGVFPIVNLLNSTIDIYNKCFNINVRAPFLFSREISKNMKKNKWGRIVNIGSSSAYNGSEDTGIYCASKHALLGLTRSLYKELKSHNIRVYSVAPGSIQTDMGATDTRQDFSTFLNPKEIAEYITHIISYDKEMISEEVRLNRVVVR
jgi:3-oxoacyl-[acyl-carrier protein] reductase